MALASLTSTRQLHTKQTVATENDVIMALRFLSSLTAAAIFMAVNAITVLSAHAQDSTSMYREFTLVVSGDAMAQMPATVMQGDPGFMGVVSALQAPDISPPPLHSDDRSECGVH
jgi:hypothetical protein